MKLLLTSVVIILVSIPLLGECSPAEKRALEELDRSWAEATRTANRTALEQIVAGDFVGLSPGGEQTRKQMIDAAVRDAEAARRATGAQPQTTFDHYMITCTATTAVVTHRNVTRATEGGKEEVSYGRSVHVMEKRGGRWQVVSNAGHALGDAATLAYMERDWANAMVNRDTAWFEHNLADDYTGVNPMTGALMTKEEDIRESAAMGFTSAEMSDINTRVVGDTAVVTGIATVRGKEKDGKPFDARVRFTDVFVKRDGRWVALSSHPTILSPESTGTR